MLAVCHKDDELQALVYFYLGIALFSQRKQYATRTTSYKP